jgi:hypothetical protein
VIGVELGWFAVSSPQIPFGKQQLSPEVIQVDRLAFQKKVFDPWLACGEPVGFEGITNGIDTRRGLW